MPPKKPREDKTSNNPDGNNQWGAKAYPDDETLSKSLHEYARRKYTIPQRLQALADDHGLVVGKTKLNDLNNKYQVPSVRKRLEPGAEVELVAEQLDQDTRMANGYRAVSDLLRIGGVAIPRDRVRAIMIQLCPEGFEKRFPGSRRIVRVPLTAFGPFHEIASDGHLKLGSQALKMGPVGLPIYAMKDKWSDCVPFMVTAPNVQTEAAVGHLYLDFVEEQGAIPIQFTTDCGSETGWVYAYQYTLREQVAPEIDLNQFPPHRFIKSVHNTVIEGFWSWLRKKRGLQIKEAIIQGRDEGRFLPNNPLHIEVFYFIFPPLVQKELDDFRKYWNYHKVRSQREKQMAQNHIPIDAFEKPANYGAMDCRIRIPKEIVQDLRTKLEEEVGSRSLHLEFLSAEAQCRISEIYKAIGSPALCFGNAWEVFTAMVEFEPVMEE